jgi:hypothetical protein
MESLLVDVIGDQLALRELEERVLVLPDLMASRRG